MSDDESIEELSDNFNHFVHFNKNELEFFVEVHFGERCPDFEQECECCKRWAALDLIFKNPYED